MPDTPFPAHMLAWKASSDMIRMEEILVGDPTRTIQGFAPDKEFNAPASKLAFDDPYEDDEDRLNKVSKYWKGRDKERLQREARYKELLDAEVEAAVWRKAEEIMQAKEKAKEEAATREKEKGLEKEKAVGPVGEKETRPSGVNKGKAREVPKTPRKVTPRKSQTEVQSESEEDEDEDKPQCIYCMKKNITCVPQVGKKTAWAVMDGSQKVADAVRELVEMEKRQKAGRLEVVWHDLRMFLIQVEQKAAVDSVAVDARVLQKLELKSKGVEIPVDIEKRIRAECNLVQKTLEENTEDLTERMDSIWKCMAWTNNGLYQFKDPTPPPAPPPPVAVQGTKRKNDEESCADGNKKKKKEKKVVETEKDDSTLC
ncbi:hypothetical protein M422DRAFT_254589 [Sphaerobolus stellatus SS14]|uniref:Uncharacterized protein n=1 Tax=Sphaerobolus stellatus (strain SS14) TaxID=990650 RepID=A0A0C9VUE9_SPHS4|nr:hypothetical protein M422DRAFT_254589 [Sphaerobolus stellatus SS14]